MPIIEVKNLGKKYIIGDRHTAPYVALRDTLTEIGKNPVKWIKNKIQSLNRSNFDKNFWALKDINFTVEKGEILGVIGHNGAGKSTLLKIFSRITPPTVGEICLRGRVGSLLEVGTGFHQELSGRENIYLNGAILGMSKKEIDRKFQQIIDFADIGNFLDVPVKRYSSGMQVRLAFSVAAHLEPEILIIDEVLAVGDAEFQKKCLGKIAEVTKKDGRTVLFVSHNLGAVRSICSRCLLLEAGKIKAIGEPNEIIREYMLANSLNSSVVIDKKQHVKGNNDATITGVTMMNQNDHLTNSFLINEKLQLSIDYIINNESREFSFWVAFFDSEGVPLLSSFQRDTGRFIKPKLGKNNIKVEFENIGLVPGRYVVSLGVISHDGPTLWDDADWVDNCLTLDISNVFFNGRHFENRIGRVDRQAVWNSN